MNNPEQQPENFHDVARQREALRKALRDAQASHIPESLTHQMQSDLDATNKQASTFKVADYGGFGKAKEFLKKQAKESEKTEWIDESLIAQELGGEYSHIAQSSEDIAHLTDFEMRRLRENKTNSHAIKAHENLLAQITKEKQTLSTEITNIQKENPTLYKAHELVSYKQGLHHEGHIAPTPSVRNALGRIGRKMISGKPMFLHGPTGTGKTSLARYAAKHFTGRGAEMVYCTPQTREANIWGKTGIRPNKEGAIQTVDIYGPLAKAMRDGTTVIFDEFTALPKEQMVFVKGIFNAKPGDSVNVVGNGKTTIAPGFQMIFTTNLKSEKNPERQELPPEIAREFEQNNLKINYTPKNEAYDIMLARLMNKDGSVDLSYYDLNETLPKFIEAMHEIQIAYTGTLSDDEARLIGAKDVSGKTPGLKKFVITQGTVEAILEEWQTERQLGTKQSFVEFLDQSLKNGLTFEEYSEKDRILATKILASKGLLRTLSLHDLGLPKDVFAVNAIKKLRGKGGTQDIKEQSEKIEHIPLKELAELDTFGIKAQTARERAEQFLPKEEKTAGSTVSPETEQELLESNRDFLTDTFTTWFNAKDAKKATQSVEILSPTDIDYETLAGEKDPTKFGNYTISPETMGLDYEKIITETPEKFKVETFTEFVGKPRWELAKHLAENYADKYYIPGLDFYKYLHENPDKIPEAWKDGNYYYDFGSVLCYRDGLWYAPCSFWDGDKWYRLAYWLQNVWEGNDRVLLLEK